MEVSEIQFWVNSNSRQAFTVRLRRHALLISEEIAFLAFLFTFRYRTSICNKLKTKIFKHSLILVERPWRMPTQPKKQQCERNFIFSIELYVRHNYFKFSAPFFNLLDSLSSLFTSCRLSSCRLSSDYIDHTYTLCD